MGILSKALGAGSTVEHKGKTYRLSGFTLGAQAEYESYLEGYAVQKAITLRRFMPHDAGTELDPLVLVVRDITAGSYTFGSKLVADSLNVVHHLKRAIFIMMQECDPKVTLQEASSVIDEKFDEFIATMRVADSDPNHKSPEWESASSGLTSEPTKSSN